jgi:hypothetical protein
MPPITAQSRSARVAAQLAKSRRHSASDADVESSTSGEDTADSSDSSSDVGSDEGGVDRMGYGHSDKWPTNAKNIMSNGNGSHDDQSDDEGSGDDLPSYSEVTESLLDAPTVLCWDGAISPLALDAPSPGLQMTTRSLILVHTDWSFRSDEPDGERKCEVIWPMSVEHASPEYRPLLIESQHAGAGRADGYSHVIDDIMAVKKFAAVWKSEWDEALDPELIGLLRKVCVTRTKAMYQSYCSMEGIKSPVSIVSRSEWRRRANPNEVYLGNPHNTAESDRGIRYTIAQHDDGMGHTLSVSWESALGWDEEEGDVLVSKPGDAFTMVRFKQEPINGSDMAFIDLAERRPK